MVRFTLNGQAVTSESPPDTPLLWVLREELQLTGTKFGCGIAQCGACTVHLDGSAARACVTPVTAVANRHVTTIEGLATPVGAALKSSWEAEQVPQCGYCQPGQIMQAVSRVNEVRRKEGRTRITDRDIEQIRNICRCGTYQRIRAAVHRAAELV